MTDINKRVQEDPGSWVAFCDCLDDDLRFVGTQPGMTISVGAKLLTARHVNLNTRQDLSQVPVTVKAVWTRVADPATAKRRLSPTSRSFLEFWRAWAALPPQMYPLQQPVCFTIHAAADAMAAGESFGIGGFVRLPNGEEVWFSEFFNVADLAFTKVAFSPLAQRDITCYEALGQMALLLCLARHCPGSRLSVRMSTWCDNTGAESASDKLYSSRAPLCFVVQRLALLSIRTGILLDVSHIPGVCNDDADFLSRWPGDTDISQRWPPAFRERISLQDLWAGNPPISVVPADYRLKWDLPERFLSGPSKAAS